MTLELNYSNFKTLDNDQLKDTDGGVSFLLYVSYKVVSNHFKCSSSRSTTSGGHSHSGGGRSF